jgi:hypothetical protein
MAITVGMFRPPAQPVSITDGAKQVEFDSPADMWDYLSRHPELAAEVHTFHWTLQPLSSGH